MSTVSIERNREILEAADGVRSWIEGSVPSGWLDNANTIRGWIHTLLEVAEDYAHTLYVADACVHDALKAEKSVRAESVMYQQEARTFSLYGLPS